MVRKMERNWQNYRLTFSFVVLVLLCTLPTVEGKTSGSGSVIGGIIGWCIIILICCAICGCIYGCVRQRRSAGVVMVSAPTQSVNTSTPVNVNVINNQQPPQPGYPPMGYPPTGYPPTGYPSSGYPPTGYPPMGYPPNAYMSSAPQLQYADPNAPPPGYNQAMQSEASK